LRTVRPNINSKPYWTHIGMLVQLFTRRWPIGPDGTPRNPCTFRAKNGSNKGRRGRWLVLRTTLGIGVLVPKKRARLRKRWRMTPPERSCWESPRTMNGWPDALRSGPEPKVGKVCRARPREVRLNALSRARSCAHRRYSWSDHPICLSTRQSASAHYSSRQSQSTGISSKQLRGVWLGLAREQRMVRDPEMQESIAALARLHAEITAVRPTLH
jgi:hypothetical protein